MGRQHDPSFTLCQVTPILGHCVLSLCNLDAAVLQSPTMNPRKKTAPPAPIAPHACVIGAGIGGLALAIRLQAAGMQTVLVEARNSAGGLIRSWQRDGFTFDAGPAVIADPAPLRELWSLTGQDLADDLKLLEVAPAWRCNWPAATRPR